MEPVPLSEALHQLFRRMMQQAMQEQTAKFWRKRAEQFESARPRKSDYRGDATDADLKRRDDYCAQTALACNRHADLLESGDVPDWMVAEIDEVLGLAA